MKKFFSSLLLKVYSTSRNFTERVANSYWNKYYKKEFKYIGPHYSIARPNRIINPQYISIGENFFCLYNLRIEAIDNYAGVMYAPAISIGDNVDINSDCHIAAINKIEIGNNVLLASKVFITDHSHGEINNFALATPPSKRILVSKGPVIIHDNVWIGEGVCILSGVTIGKNSIIGANSVVNKDMPANAVIGGIPARVLRLLN